MENETGIAEPTRQINLVTRKRIGDIGEVNRELVFLAMNAMIVAASAISSGKP